MLERLRGGDEPAAILSDLEQSESGLGWRQLAVIDAGGRAAFFNGDKIYSVHKGKVGRDCVAAGLLVVHRESFAFVDLRVDLDPRPLVQLRFLWELYQPAADEYVVLAVDPDKVPRPA